MYYDIMRKFTFVVVVLIFVGRIIILLQEEHQVFMCERATMHIVLKTLDLKIKKKLNNLLVDL